MIFEMYLFIYLFGHFDGLPIPPGYLMTFCYIKMMNIVNILKHFCIVIVSMFKVGNHKEMHLMFIYGHVSVHLMNVNTILPILLIAPLCSQACSCGVCLLIQQQQTKWATCQHATVSCSVDLREMARFASVHDSDLTWRNFLTFIVIWLIVSIKIWTIATS